MKRFLNLILVAFVFISTLLITNDTFARRYSRSYTKNVINKTAYIIEQAYDIAFAYDYWSEHYLAKAVYYNDYAYDLYRRNCRSAAVHYSLKSRQYALKVIDNCNDYWEFFYFNYFGWSFSFGYNPNFAYASGYANGYYDGYFAAYCNRHAHNPHHGHGHQPPHHNNNNGHGGNNNGHGGTMKPTNGHVIGRGDTGATNPNITTGGGVISKGSYVNINYDEYFSADELNDLKELPNDDALENNFRKERPNVSFDSKELSKPNNEMMRRTKEISQEYSKGNKEKGQTTITKQIVPVSTLNKEVQAKPTKEIKPATNEIKPANKEVKPANKEVKPANKEVKPANKEVKPANKEVKPANKEVKPANKEVKPANKEVKPANKEVKPANKEVKPAKETKTNNKTVTNSKNAKNNKATTKTSKNTKNNKSVKSTSKTSKSSSKSTKSTKSTSTKAKSEKKLNR